MTNVMTTEDREAIRAETRELARRHAQAYTAMVKADWARSLAYYEAEANACGGPEYRFKGGFSI